MLLNRNKPNLDAPEPNSRKKLNISEEEREKRRERMKKLQERLHKVETGKQKVEKTVKPLKSEPQSEMVKTEDVINQEEDTVQNLSESEDEAPAKPAKKAPEAKPKKSNAKAAVRKVLKIKYYAEPSAEEMLADRLFLESAHRTDEENELKKKKPATPPPPPAPELDPIQKNMNKYFNY